MIALGWRDRAISAEAALADRDRLIANLQARVGELKAALSNLHTMVWGECPSLLEEDSGGSAHTDMEIRRLIDAR